MNQPAQRPQNLLANLPVSLKTWLSFNRNGLKNYLLAASSYNDAIRRRLNPEETRNPTVSSQSNFHAIPS